MSAQGKLGYHVSQGESSKANHLSRLNPPTVPPAMGVTARSVFQKRLSLGPDLVHTWREGRTGRSGREGFLLGVGHQNPCSVDKEMGWRRSFSPTNPHLWARNRTGPE